MNLTVVPIKGKQMISPIKEQLMTANQAFGWNEQQTMDDFNNDFSEYYCLMKQETLIGFIGLHHLFDEVSINTVFIDPQWRKQQLASYLLAYVLEQLQYRQVKHVFLEVRASNEAAIKLYRRQHFQLLTTRKEYYQFPKEDAFIFQKLLIEE